MIIVALSRMRYEAILRLLASGFENGNLDHLNMAFRTIDAAPTIEHIVAHVVQDETRYRRLSHLLLVADARRAAHPLRTFPSQLPVPVVREVPRG